MPREHLSSPSFPRKETLALLTPKADHTRMVPRVPSASRSVQKQKPQLKNSPTRHKIGK